MIPLSEKKVKRSSGKSNTICENRRKNKSLVKYVLQKNSQGLPVRALFVPKTGSKCVCHVPAVCRRAAKPCVLPAGQLPFLRTERLPLHAHLPHTQLRAPGKGQKPFHAPASIMFTLRGAYFPHRFSLYSAASSFVTALPRRYFTNAAASRAYFESVAALLPSAASARMYSRRHSAPLCPNAYLLQPFYPDNKPKIRSGARKAVENILTNHAGQTVDLRRDM